MHGVSTQCCCGDHHYMAINRGFTCLVSPEDASILDGNAWHVTHMRACRYVIRRVRKDGVNKQIHIHREIMKPVGKEVVDHINHNGLDNRRRNLRIANASQNSSNKSKPGKSSTGFIGVWFCKEKKKRPFRACVCFNNKLIYLGRYATAEAAAAVRDQAAIKYLGEFALLNFPDRRDEYQQSVLSPLQTEKQDG